MLAMGSLISWTVMFARVLVISVAVYPALIHLLLVPVAIMAMATLTSVAVLYWLHIQAKKAGEGEKDSGSANISISTPFTLTQAAKFGLLFAVILLLVKIIGDQSREEGLYLVALLAGLTDVDAITLSMSQYARSGGAAEVATIAIIIGVLANSAVKAGMAAILGSADYRRQMLAATALLAVAGAMAGALDLAAG
jgi:uncharacterized membrane protein (DUF4010 family)